MRPQWHCIERLGLKLLLDANSGSLHLLDDVSHRVLPYFPAAGEEAARRDLAGEVPAAEVRRAWQELERLVQEGMLLAPAPDPPDGDQLGPLQALCLHVAHDCDLACRYCFGGGGTFGGGRSLMSPETGCQAIDFLLANCGSRRHLEVDFFGGEPLLNLETVQRVVEYARGKGRSRGIRFSFTLTTNGLQLDQAARRWLEEQEISLVLSADGRPWVHDHHRPLPGGSGSFRQVLPRLQETAARRPGADCVVRGTFTAYNLDFSRDALYLVERGFGRISLEPVVLEGGPLALESRHLPRLEAEYDRLARAYVQRNRQGRPFDFFHFRVYFEEGPCLSRRMAGCGAGHRYAAVDPDGGLYPCHQFVGQESYRLGDLEGGLAHPGLMREFRDAHVFNKPRCRDCWARFFCSGGCHANNVALGGGLREPHPLGCELSRLRIEYALAVRACLALEEAAPGETGASCAPGAAAGIQGTGGE